MAKIKIKLKSYDHRILDEASKEITGIIKETGSKVSGPIPLPTKRTLFSTIRSPFIYKKSQEQFELRIHKRLIEVKEPTKETLEALTRITLPAGVDVEIKT